MKLLFMNKILLFGRHGNKIMKTETFLSLFPFETLQNISFLRLCFVNIALERFANFQA